MAARPSPVTGVLSALRLWRLVLAVWLVPMLLLAPLTLGWSRAIGRAVGDLPPQAPRAEAWLLALDALRPGLAFQLLLLAAAAVGTWLWTILWHAAVVQWRVWAWEREVRLGPLVGLGAPRAFAYLRLALTAVAATVVLEAVVWIVVAAARAIAAEGAETAVTRSVLAGVVASLLVAVIAWLATLRGAWLLGLPGRRSAVLAWLDGLAGTARQPFASVGTLLLLGGAALLAQALPLLAGRAAPTLAGGPAAALLGVLGGLAAAFGWVALFAAFAPVTGLPEPTPRRADRLSPPPAAA